VGYRWGVGLSGLTLGGGTGESVTLEGDGDGSDTCGRGDRLCTGTLGGELWVAGVGARACNGGWQLLVGWALVWKMSASWRSAMAWSVSSWGKGPWGCGF
jgi:hypothetical protein